jgi:hypothetical protein
LQNSQLFLDEFTCHGRMALLTKFGNDNPKFLGKLKLWDDPFFCVFDPMAVPQDFIEMFREKNNIQNFH